VSRSLREDMCPPGLRHVRRLAPLGGEADGPRAYPWGGRMLASACIGLAFGATACARPVNPGTAPSDPSRLAPVFEPSPHPSLPKLASPLSLGMPIDDARRAAPALFEQSPLHAVGLDDVTMSAHADAYRRLGSFVVDLRCATALGDLTSLWGPPVSGYDVPSKSKLSWWFDPDARLRATLEAPDTADKCRLVLDRYLAIAELFGNRADRFGFERDPLIGMSEADVVRVYSDYVSGPSARPCNAEVLVLPPVEYDRTFTRLRLYCKAGTIHAFEIIIRYATKPDLKDEIVERLTRKFGTPALTRTAAGMLTFPGVSNLNVRLRNDAFMKEATIDVYPPP